MLFCELLYALSSFFSYFCFGHLTCILVLLYCTYISICMQLLQVTYCVSNLTCGDCPWNPTPLFMLLISTLEYLLGSSSCKCCPCDYSIELYFSFTSLSITSMWVCELWFMKYYGSMLSNTEYSITDQTIYIFSGNVLPNANLWEAKEAMH